VIHFIISFCYVMAGAAAVILLPFLGDWVRTDLAVIGAVIGVLAAANVHFYIAQSERVRRSQNGLEWLQARLSAAEDELAQSRRDLDMVRADQDTVRDDAERRIAQTVDEVRILQELLERYIQTQRSRDRKTRLRAMVANRSRDAQVSSSGERLVAGAAPEDSEPRLTGLAGNGQHFDRSA